MAEKTEIAWTDSTFNPWWGCTKVAPGCNNCYANALDKRIGGNYWNNKIKPRTLSDNYWKAPAKWNTKNTINGGQHKVFCGSMCDWADKNAPIDQRVRLWRTIRETPSLQWLMLTKRAPNMKKYLPNDWGDGYQNVWLGVTVENRKHGLQRLEILRNSPAKIRFLSIEPLLEDLGQIDLTGIHWVIVGGESGPHARIMKEQWVYNIHKQMYRTKSAFLFQAVERQENQKQRLDIRA